MIPITKKRFPKKTIIVTSVVAALALGAITYVYGFNGNLFGWQASQKSSNTDNSGNYKPATPEQQQSGTDIKSDTVNNQSTPSKPSTNTTETPTTPAPQGTNKSTVTVDISSQNQTSTTYQIGVDIGVVTNDGTCTLTLTKGSSVVTKTSLVYALAKTTTCQGFNIPMTELSAGTWQLNIVFSNSTLTGTVTKSITIQ